MLSGSSRVSKRICPWLWPSGPHRVRPSRPRPQTNSSLFEEATASSTAFNFQSIPHFWVATTWATFIFSPHFFLRIFSLGTPSQPEDFMTVYSSGHLNSVILDRGIYGILLGLVPVPYIIKQHGKMKFSPNPIFSRLVFGKIFFVCVAITR